jgi:hypothetical protein
MGSLLDALNSLDGGSGIQLSGIRSRGLGH